MSHRPITRRIAAVVVAAILVVACGPTGGGSDERFAPARPDVTRAGIQATGTIGGSQLAVSAGAPRLVEGNCDPASGPSTDVCFIARDLTGERFTVIFANPDVLVAGADLDVAASDCVAAECAAVSDVAVVDILAQGADRRRAADGRLQITIADPGERYAGSFRLQFRDGRLSGDFDVVPRP